MNKTEKLETIKRICEYQLKQHGNITYDDITHDAVYYDQDCENWQKIGANELAKNILDII